MTADKRKVRNQHGDDVFVYKSPSVPGRVNVQSWSSGDFTGMCIVNLDPDELIGAVRAATGGNGSPTDHEKLFRIAYLAERAERRGAGVHPDDIWAIIDERKA